MSTFKVTGGKKLQGEIIPQGAKNEALQILSAVLLTDQEITIHNIPSIRDVLKLIELLGELGVVVKKLSDSSYTFKASNIDLEYLNSADFKAKGAGLRGSIMIIGPLLARFGKGYIPSPGGDKIGRRRLDTHFIGFMKLGAKFEYLADEQFYKVSSENGRLKGAYMLLDEASVTGTANILPAFNMQLNYWQFPQGYSFIQYAKVAADQNFRRVLPYGTMTGDDTKTATYANTPAINAAALMLAENIWTSRFSTQNGGTSVDGYSPSPFKMSNTLMASIRGLLAPYLSPSAMVG